ncbi:DUF4177 domain-containing protein [Enterococcus pallens]|uniref:DUF4177 domain-containing protein n=1 Tax=Enterococcus pallens ATCC BAA-351 TaxID=1158607 RepID=R2SFX3_9ENTE|nr:DUF4177 domain-containing protein [Enterococcus pallens]EOH94250.1 hypothetical protein UAU_01985 [Enterococcus pallens ATCC BAA-351]EOU24129.1 hypothetical protein I588_00116 [Enterococcus pallens ATCC BAA-351]OJG82099.1 hypothetical protein RV10_GL001963 [Enterococcus pallens]
MYEYRSEILITGMKWVSDKADENDLYELDELINQRAREGWELATYSYMATTLQIRGATLITFKRLINE